MCAGWLQWRSDHLKHSGEWGKQGFGGGRRAWHPPLTVPRRAATRAGPAWPKRGRCSTWAWRLRHPLTTSAGIIIPTRGAPLEFPDRTTHLQGGDGCIHGAIRAGIRGAQVSSARGTGCRAGARRSRWRCKQVVKERAACAHICRALSGAVNWTSRARNVFQNALGSVASLCCRSSVTWRRCDEHALSQMRRKTRWRRLARALPGWAALARRQARKALRHCGVNHVSRTTGRRGAQPRDVPPTGGHGAGGRAGAGGKSSWPPESRHGCRQSAVSTRCVHMQRQGRPLPQRRLRQAQTQRMAGPGLHAADKQPGEYWQGPAAGAVAGETAGAEQAGWGALTANYAH